MAVTVLAREVDEAFEVPPELEAELDLSLAEAARGEAIPLADALRQLRGV